MIKTQNIENINNLPDNLPDNLSDNLSDIENQNITETQCMICYEDIDEINWIIFDCNHRMCLECLQKLYANRKHKDILCPFCRSVIEKSNKPKSNYSFYDRVYINISQNPIACFILNFMSFIIFIGILMIAPTQSQNLANNDMSKYSSNHQITQHNQQAMYQTQTITEW